MKAHLTAGLTVRIPPSRKSIGRLDWSFDGWVALDKNGKRVGPAMDTKEGAVRNLLVELNPA